jgi:electron transfer flavoprotein alpha subunit
MPRDAGGPLRIASLAKQVPPAESLELRDGRLARTGPGLEMNPYCRRAVAQGVTLARETGGTCTVVTLGPPAAEDVLREAIAWGADAGLHACDRAFAGSDTLATARALAGVLHAAGPFDLILLGRNSVDGETGQVGPELAELLDLPFAGGVRRMQDGGALWRLELELDDGTQEVELALPAVLSVAERLCDPCKVDDAGRAAVAPARLSRMEAIELGPGPWGDAGSPTEVGATRPMDQARSMLVLDGPVDAQVDEAVRLLTARGALTARPDPPARPPGDDRTADRRASRVIAVLG